MTFITNNNGKEFYNFSCIINSLISQIQLLFKIYYLQDDEMTAKN